jgi:hypothetical protein
VAPRDLLISAYREEEVIERKINALALEYPRAPRSRRDLGRLRKPDERDRP